MLIGSSKKASLVCICLSFEFEMFSSPTVFMNTWPPVDVTAFEGYGTFMTHGAYMKKKGWTVF